jgi:hypothetical protein
MRILSLLLSLSLLAAQDTLCITYTKAVVGTDTGDNELANILTEVIYHASFRDSESNVQGTLANTGGLILERRWTHTDSQLLGLRRRSSQPCAH